MNPESTNSTRHALWHPFADMGVVDGDRMVITRAAGPWVWDDSGARYLDGTHGIGTAVGGIAANSAGFGILVPDASSVVYDDPNALEAEIQRVGPERVAAFFCEPVIGAGGVLLPPAGYIESVADICARYG